MCGVVSYFGGEPGAISRIITGMSAIIYRAPDSTGIGMFGTLTEPVAMRKCLGSVTNMMDVFLNHGFHSADHRIMTELRQGLAPSSPVEMQRRLIAFEGLSQEYLDKMCQKENSYPSPRDIINMCGQSDISSLLGRVGKTGAATPVFTVRSRDDFRTMIKTLVLDFNLSAVAVKSLIKAQISNGCDALEKSVLPNTDEPKNRSLKGKALVTRSDVFAAFDYLYQKTIEELYPVSAPLRDMTSAHINPHSRKVLWRLIAAMQIRVPTDFSQDGMTYLFRTVDSAVLSRIPGYPAMILDFQKKLNAQMPAPGMDWLTLYAWEKALNVLGRAVGVALEWVREHRIRRMEPPGFSRHSMSTYSSKKQKQNTAGDLDYLAQPMIGHGRWALQSAVTVKNAHPFTDARHQRLIALNGQFSADVEEEMLTFLTQVAGLTLCTQNSGEYLALFWGYYFDALYGDKKRFQAIQQQTELGLDDYGAGSTTINYRIFKELKDKDIRQIDEMAFIKATALFTRKGGQIAVTGISMVSPETLYAAASNRPLFVVRRRERDDYMVVSDINAALGLFSQKEILTATREYDVLVARRKREIEALPFSSDFQENRKNCIDRYNQKIQEALDRLKVVVYPMEGRDLFARIETGWSPEHGVFRTLSFTDFQGTPVHDVDTEEMNLTPPHVHKDMNRSFFESHMQEVPHLLQTMYHAVFNEENMAINPIQVNRKALERRFGKQMGGLRRIVLAGMGTAFHTCLSSAVFLRRQLPHIQIVCLKPLEITYLYRQISPEQDLVVAVSWSGTTAEMVDFAKKIHQMGTLCISVTEKTVGDLALITRKSAGTIYTMSGEEVTVPAVKSTFCMAMALNLFGMWFHQQLQKKTPASADLRDLEQIPGILEQMLTDKELTDTITALAFFRADSRRLVIIGDRDISGADMDAALKMEEMTWTLKTRSVDYRQIPGALLRGAWSNTQVMVTATHPHRMAHALEAMAQLHRAGISFTTLTWEGRDLDTIRHFSRKVILIPRLPAALQHFANLVFYYQLSFFAGRARGRMDDDFPRNRAKSVTTSRSVPPALFSPKNELFALYHRETLFQTFSSTAVDWDQATLWEKQAQGEMIQETIAHFKMMGQALESNDPPSRFLHHSHDVTQEMATELFHNHDIDHICFHPLDGVARSAVLQTISVLERFFPCTLRCARPGEGPRGVSRRTLELHVTSLEKSHPSDLWHQKTDLYQRLLCPAPSHIQNPMDGIPEIYFHTEFRQIDECLVYTSLMMLLVSAWKQQDPVGSALVLHHFQHSAAFIHNMLNQQKFIEEIRQNVRRNHAYNSLLYLSPADGSGALFTRRFDEISHCMASWQAFGNSAHGPLVTVDPEVEKKYICLESRSRMMDRFGENNIRVWEKKYLEGMDVDTFLTHPPEKTANIVNSPFYTQENWYLPLLLPDYDTARDNLIILDGAGEFYFEQAIDDLVVLGSRHTRMILITQETLINAPEKQALKKYPLSGIIHIPSLPGKDRPLPLSQCHLPFATALIAAAMADYKNQLLDNGHVLSDTTNIGS